MKPMSSHCFFSKLTIFCRFRTGVRSAFGGGACVFFLSVGELKGDNSADLGPFLEFVFFLPFLEDVGCSIASSGDAPRERARACSHPQRRLVTLTPTYAKDH